MSRAGDMTRRTFMGKFAATGAGIMAGVPWGFRTPLAGMPEPGQVAAPAAPDWAAVRANFPRAEKSLWLAAAETHPFSVHTLRAIENYCQYRALGPGEGRKSYTPEMQNETKRMFGDLIGAKPEEIAFTMSTTDGENSVIAGIDLARKGGNVVIDDLHFIASKWMYGEMHRKGQIELRIVRHRDDWKIRLEDMARAIDKNTRLVSMALVSNVNGYMHDARAISDLAHGQGALVYGDIIQGVGNTPLDVRAMGLDCCASSTYKWLMGDFGLGFLYVREDLQENVVKQTRYGARQIGGSKGGEYYAAPGAARYEGTTTMPYLPGICAYEGLTYVTKLGVGNIRAHAKSLTDRLQKEMPSLGFISITPLDSPTPIVSFATPDINAVQNKLNRAFNGQVVSVGHWEKTDDKGNMETVNGIRIGVSVYNNDADIDKFLNALSRS